MSKGITVPRCVQLIGTLCHVHLIIIFHSCNHVGSVCRNPNKGILFLVSEQLLEDSPYDVANFLLTSKGLSKLRIGEYLGDQNEFNVAVLQ